ncbi:cocE [Symbiodinium sp. KB8]|nr:cocE [Symbiodinium sp. KB8]
MRGTQQSEGQFNIWHSGSNDSYDTMKWIAEQSWSNGLVSTTGASADGLNEFTEVIGQNHPWLRSQFIIFASSSGYEVAFPGGAARKSLIELWIGSTVPSQAPAKIQEVYDHEAPGPWWNVLNGTGNFQNVHFPSVMWAGWYDIFLVGNLIGTAATTGTSRRYNGYQYQAAPGHTGKSKLVVDPLGHCQAGAKYFPKNTILGRVLLPILLAYDMFKEDTTVPEDVKDVTFYVMGADPNEDAGNYWTTLDGFPAYTATPFYLGTNGNLTTTAPGHAGYSADSYLYNPANPVPSAGGNNLEIECGPRAQAAPGSRADVKSYVSAPLAEALWVTGPLNAVLHVSSNATDTDFTAKLVDVYPDGTGRLIQDGIVRMRWRDWQDSDVAKPMVPGKVYEVEVSLWNTSYVFGPGHRLRVDISSSNFPRFTVNPNNFCPLSNPACAPNATALNAVHHSALHPSRIVLPVVQPADLPAHGVLESSTTALKARLGASPAFAQYIASRAVREGHLEAPAPGLRGGVDADAAALQAFLALPDAQLAEVATKVMTQLTLDSTLARLL